MHWLKSLKGKVRAKEPLKRHTTFKIGGPAEFFVEPRDADDLKMLLIGAKRYNIPAWVMGSGSNLLIRDSGVRAIVISLNSPFFKKSVLRPGAATLGAGVTLAGFVSRAAALGLRGAEFLAGIPGTVGGALVMNAGISGRQIADIVENVTVMDYNGGVKTLDAKHIRFGYRSSGLSRYIVLGAKFRMKKGSPLSLKKELKRRLEYRRATQDYRYPSAGCVFKNPPGHSAGQLIDGCGLKGRCVNGACISMIHANFIVNRKGAAAKDVKRLMGIIKYEVKRKFNITLEPEIKVW